MLRNMLIPLDGSTISEKIIDHSLPIAEVEGSGITLLTVVDPDEVYRSKDGPGPDRAIPDVRPQDQPPGLENSSGDATFPQTRSEGIDLHEYDSGAGYGTQVIESIAESANSYVNRVAARVSAEVDGVRVRAQVTIGNPEDEILRVAREEDVDLIAMATRSNNALARGILGSVTDRIIRASEKPVLVIHPTGDESVPQKPGTVIAPLDGSAASETAIPVASTMAERLNAELVFVRVSNHLDLSLVPNADLQLSDDYADAFVEPYLRPIVSRAKKSGLSASMRTPRGGTVKCLTDIADEYDNSMIVMGTRGHSGVKRLLLGSVTDKMIRVSGHPVIVVPSEMNWLGSVL